MVKAGQDNSDLRLMELARRNPSLGGRELMLEVIERGPMPEENERPQPRDIRSALMTLSLDDPDYRTPIEHADWLGKESQVMRDLYERGAEIKGDVLTIPAEEYELRDDSETPFITTLSYAQERIGDVERVQEFHALALAISGETADARMRIAVFKHYYDRIARDERGNRFGRDREVERDDRLGRTIDEMRLTAAEMAKLETRASVEVSDHIEREPGSIGERDVESVSIKMNVAARKVNLRDESLRFPADLGYETKERLVSLTIPEIDRRLESGVSREAIFNAIDNTLFQRDSRDLTAHELNVRIRIAGFLKAYSSERLRDPETHTLNTSAVFREARAAIINTITPEDLGRVAGSFLRANKQRSEELQRHRNAPDLYPRPAVMPLNARERNLLFNGRAPESHTSEMRELRINYGLSRAERAARVEGVHQGLTEPSEVLKQMIDELEKRKTAKAISHFQASLLNEQMIQGGKLNLQTLYHRIPPHERTYLFELTEVRKRALLKTQERDHQEKSLTQPIGRSFGAMPKESNSLREYLAGLGQVERQLLNEELRRLRINTASGEDRNTQTITEARNLLPDQTARAIRSRARDLAWERIAPRDVFESKPLPEAIRLSDTISQIQENLQERARIAQNARDEFLVAKIREAELRHDDREGIVNDFSFYKPKEERDRFAQAVIANLSSEDAQKLVALDRYAAQTREEVYRGFEAIDIQRRDLEMALDKSAPLRVESYASLQGDDIRSPYLTSVFAHSGQSMSQLASRSSASNEQRDDEARSEMNFTHGFLDSDREWHFDSLRDVIKPELPGHQIAPRERGDQFDSTAEHNLVFQR